MLQAYSTLYFDAQARKMRNTDFHRNFKDI